MYYYPPESNVFVICNIVETSQVPDNDNSGSNMGGIQLPFIPG